LKSTVKMKYETKVGRYLPSIIGKSSENDLTRSDLEREPRRLGKMHPVAKLPVPHGSCCQRLSGYRQLCENTLLLKIEVRWLAAGSGRLFVHWM